MAKHTTTSLIRIVVNVFLNIFIFSVLIEAGFSKGLIVAACFCKLAIEKSVYI